MDYYSPPPLSDQTYRITGQLIGWLLSQSDENPPDWNNFEWETAIWVAYHLKAMTWLAARLRENHMAIPQEITQHLFALEASSRARTKMMLQLAVDLMATLQKAGVPVMPMKGTLLAASYYPDPFLRPLMDMDILVPVNQFHQGEQIMKVQGFHIYGRSAKDIAFVKGQRLNNVWSPEHWKIVDLHWAVDQQLENGLVFDLAKVLWAHCKLRPFLGGQQEFLPSPAALLVHICTHASADWLIHRGSVMQLMDIRILTSKMSETDWQSFREIIQSEEVRMIYPALAVVCRFGSVMLPPDILKLLRERSPVALIAWADQVELANITPFSTQQKKDKKMLIGLIAHSRLEAAAMLLRLTFPRRYDLYHMKENFGDSPFWKRNFDRLIHSPFWLLAYPLINLYRMRRASQPGRN